MGPKVHDPPLNYIKISRTQKTNTENEHNKKEKHLQIKWTRVCNIYYHISFIKIPTYDAKLRISHLLSKFIQ